MWRLLCVGLIAVWLGAIAWAGFGEWRERHALTTTEYMTGYTARMVVAYKPIESLRNDMTLFSAYLLLNDEHGAPLFWIDPKMLCHLPPQKEPIGVAHCERDLLGDFPSCRCDALKPYEVAFWASEVGL